MNKIKVKENNFSTKQTKTTKIKQPIKRLDGRSATRTGRIVQFATSVTVEFDNTIRQLAREEGLMMAEVLEKSLQIYKDNIEREREREQKLGKARKK